MVVDMVEEIVAEMEMEMVAEIQPCDQINPHYRLALSAAFYHQRPNMLQGSMLRM